MTKNGKEMQKQVLLLLGFLLFAFLNVFIFDDKTGIGFSAFSTITLMSIGLLSKRTELRVLALVSYVINVVTAFLGFTYVGFLTAVQAIELIFVIWYLFPREHIFRRDTTDKYTYRFRWSQLLLTVLISFAAYLVFTIISSLWDGSFLEYGGNTALIFGMQYILYLRLKKSRETEALTIARYYQKDRRSKDYKQAFKSRQVEGQGFAKQIVPNRQANESTFVRFASVWLVVMDLSILSYFLRPNRVGFTLGAFFVLLTIVLSLVIKTEERKDDVFSLIYHKIRPVQPVFFILLLIGYAYSFSYGAAYALIFAVAYFFWSINRINIKTLLTVTVLIYFFPVFGYLSNPYRLGAENSQMVLELLTDRNRSTSYHLADYTGILGLGDAGSYYEYQPAKWRVEKFVDYVSINSYYGDYTVSSGIFYNDDFDLTFSYNEETKVVEVDVLSDGKKGPSLELKDFDKTFASYQSLPSNDNDNRYQDFYRVGEVTTEYGSYSLFLRMDNQWLQEYENDPASLHYDLLVVGSQKTAKDAYQKYITE